MGWRAHLNSSKKMMHCLLQPKIRPMWWLEKRGPLFFDAKSYFQPIVLPKIPRKHSKDLNKQFMATKSQQIIQKPEIHEKQKFFPSLDVFF